MIVNRSNEYHQNCFLFSGEDAEAALAEASTHELVDLAAILGFHSLMNQEQYHASQTYKWADRCDPTVGWDGITKATPLKWYPPEEPNRTDPNDVITKLKANHRGTKKANLNNIRIKEEKFLELFQALGENSCMEELTIANTTLSDYAASKLPQSLEDNIRLERLNIESNNVSPGTLAKIFEVRLLIVYNKSSCSRKFLTARSAQRSSHELCCFYVAGIS